MRITNRILAMVALATATVMIAGFAGAVHPIGDSFAAFRLHLSIWAVLLWALSAALGGLWAERVAGLAACLGLGSMLWVALMPQSQMPEAPIRVLQHNILYNNTDLQDVQAQIAASAPDVVLLQEVHAGNASAISGYAGTPYHARCENPARTSPMILSRWPVTQLGCHETAIWAQIITPHGPVTFVSIHLRWPWPFSQAAEVAQLEQLFADIPRPVIIGGDFNSAPWSHAVSAVARATHTQRIAGLRLTFDDPRFFPGLPIDHILRPQGWAGEARLLGNAGADHRASLALIGPQAQVPR